MMHYRDILTVQQKSNSGLQVPLYEYALLYILHFLEEKSSIMETLSGSEYIFVLYE